MPRLRHYLDHDGEPITFDGCGCDEGYPCSDATCQMERDFEMRSWGRQFAHEMRQKKMRQTGDHLLGTYEQQMRDSGRGHLLPPHDLVDQLVDRYREMRAGL